MIIGNIQLASHGLRRWVACKLSCWTRSIRSGASVWCIEWLFGWVSCPHFLCQLSSGLTCLLSSSSLSSSSSSSHYLSSLHHPTFFFFPSHPLNVYLIAPTLFLLFWLVYVFSPLPPCWFVIGRGVPCGITCHQPVLWHHVCSGRLSLVSGSGLCPPRPSSPWQAAQEHFLGRYRPPHVCPRPFVPPENTWCSVFLLTCTIQWSSGTNWKWPSLKPLIL